MSQAKIRRVLSLLAAICLVPAMRAAGASLVPPRDVGEMLRASDAAVLSTAGESWTEQRGSRIFTMTSFTVARAAKGPLAAGMKIDVEAPGGETNDSGWIVAGSPRFAPGQTYFLFLHRTGRGTWQPAMLSYGVLERAEGRRGSRLLSAVPESRVIEVFPRPDGSAYEPVGVYREEAFLAHAASVAAGAAAWDSRQVLAASEEMPAGLRPQAPPAGCAFLKGGDGNGARWFKFDSGQGITMSAQSTGDSSLAGGGFSEAQAAIANWMAVPNTSIKVSYGGSVSYTLACTSDPNDAPSPPDSLVVFNDPCNDIPNLNNCSGTLAFGGPFFFSSTQTFDGAPWHASTSWFVVVNNGSGCLGSANYKLMLTHEMGHGLGFDHVSDPNANMNASCCNAINATDTMCARYLYPGSGTPAPTANFGYLPSAPKAGQAVSFLDGSSGAPTSWSWNFGDGGTSSQQNPTHTFAQLGTYNVSLTATNSAGSNTVTKAVTINTVPAPCVANATTLCLSNGQFGIQTQFSTPQGQTAGLGQAVALTSDTGYFWFFGASNVEMVIKVVDGRGFNSSFWVFAGGLTDVNVVTTVVDSKTGTVRTYTNPQGTPFQPIQDTAAFPAATAGDGSVHAPGTSKASAVEAIAAEVDSRRSRVAGGRFGVPTYDLAEAPCLTSSTALCLSGSRFKVEATWTTSNGTSGAGQAVAITPDTGYFWFFSSANVEMVIKVVDGRGFNSRFWVFAAGLTNVNVVIKVTDTLTGAVKIYTNPLNTAFVPIQDTSAFLP